VVDSHTHRTPAGHTAADSVKAIVARGGDGGLFAAVSTIDEACDSARWVRGRRWDPAGTPPRSRLHRRGHALTDEAKPVIEGWPTHRALSRIGEDG